jgi:flagellar protein FlbD
MFFSQEGQPETARRRRIAMIKLTKLNKNNDETFILNCELIETIEERPDTTIRLVNGKHFVVAESAAEVISKVVTFKRSIYR